MLRKASRPDADAPAPVSSGAIPSRRLLATEPDHLARIRREREFFAKHALADEELYWAETTPVAPRRREMRANRIALGAGIRGGEGRGKRVLDVGCGTAPYTLPLSEATQATLVGIPASWIDAVEALGRRLEATPVVREIAGSPLIRGRKPA